MQLIKLVFFVSVGALLAWWVNASDIPHTSWYALLTGALLALGLYSSTFGIVIKEARQHLGLILTAITVGVIIKAIIIGGILALVFHDPVFMLFGIVVAQIDPLSTSALMHGSRLSAKAKTILAAWSSFDDPVTVILSLYAPAFLTFVFGGHWEPVTGVASEAGIVGYLRELGVKSGLCRDSLCCLLVC